MTRKAAVYIKVSNELLSEKDMLSKSLRAKLYESKGKYFYNKKIVIGTENGDFVKNLSTILLQAYWYKKPRFINYEPKLIKRRRRNLQSRAKRKSKVPSC